MLIASLMHGLRPATLLLVQIALFNAGLCILATLPLVHQAGFAHGGVLLAGTLVLSSITLWNALKPQACLQGKAALWCLNDVATAEENVYQTVDLLNELEQLATVARRHGVVALERVLASRGVSHPFLEYSLLQAIEHKTRESLQVALHVQEEALLQESRLCVETIQGVVQPIMPVATALNALGVLVSLNAGLETAVLNSLFLVSLFGWAMVSVMLNPAFKRYIKGQANETKARHLIRLGVLSVWEQEHPSVLRQRLNNHLAPSQRLEATGLGITPSSITHYATAE